MKRPLRVIICLLCLFSYCFLFGYDLVSQYTIEEHVQRITERISKKDFSWVLTYESFEVYPLYDLNEQVNVCLVEFEPSGFVFVHLRDEPQLLCNVTGAGTSMYKRSDFYCAGQSSWSPYIVDDNYEKHYFLDERGWEFIYYKSPYRVAQVLDEKKYLIETDDHGSYICAIKKGGEYINLMNGCNVDIKDRIRWEENAVLYAGTFYRKSHDV